MKSLKFTSYYLPLLWCLFTIIGLILQLYVQTTVLDFEVLYLFGFSTVLNSLWMFICSALFGDGILTYLYIPYFIVLLLFLVAVVGSALSLLIKKSNRIFEILLTSDCIISIFTIIIICIYNAEDAFVWDKLAGVVLNGLFLIILRTQRLNAEKNTEGV